jgi:hypothetical protein
VCLYCTIVLTNQKGDDIRSACQEDVVFKTAECLVILPSFYLGLAWILRPVLLGYEG